MKFIIAIFWELVKNLPVMVLFVAAIWLWSHQRRRDAVFCCIASAVSGPLLIHVIEPLVSGGRGLWGVTLINIAVFGILQMFFTIYLGTEGKWSSRNTDFVLGALAGIGMALAQGIAANGELSVAVILRHMLALSVAFALLVNGIRQLKVKSFRDAMLGALIVNILISVAISVIDYSYLSFSTGV